jgi:hypothetical protein
LVLMMGDFRDAMVTLFKYSSTLMCYTHLCAIFLSSKDQWCFYYYLLCVAVNYLMRDIFCRVFATFWLFVLLIWCPNRYH